MQIRDLLSNGKLHCHQLDQIQLYRNLDSADKPDLIFEQFPMNTIRQGTPHDDQDEREIENLQVIVVHLKPLRLMHQRNKYSKSRCRNFLRLQLKLLSL